MPRWEQGTQERLRQSALDLFCTRGYDDVTVADIADHAGLNRRTFTRYFTDKRDVLFAGSEHLAPAIAAAVASADPRLGPWEAAAHALSTAGAQLVEVVTDADRRRAVIRSSPELQERERTKYALVVDCLAAALQDRGTPTPTAHLLAELGVALFRSAFDQWVTAPSTNGFAQLFSETTAHMLKLFEGQES